MKRLMRQKNCGEDTFGLVEANGSNLCWIYIKNNSDKVPLVSFLDIIPCRISAQVEVESGRGSSSVPSLFLRKYCQACVSL